MQSKLTLGKYLEGNRKQEVQLWEFAINQLHIIWDWTTNKHI